MSMINALKGKKSNPQKVKDKGDSRKGIKLKIDPAFTFITDPHINAHQYNLPTRADDMLKAFGDALEKCSRLMGKEGTIVLGGDVFNSAMVKPSAIIDTYRTIRDKGNWTIYSIRGNHDGSENKARRNNISLALLSEMDKDIHYIESGIITITNGKRINLIMQSYVGRNTMERLLEISDDIPEDKSDNEFNVLIIHDIVEGTTPFGAHIPREEFKAFIEEKKIDLVLSGHLHTKIVDEEIKLVNPGSTERLDIGMASDECSFLLVGFKDDELVYRWIPVETRNMEDIEIDVGDISDDDVNAVLREKIKGLEIESNSIVRFTIKGTTRSHLPRIGKKLFGHNFPDVLKIIINNKIKYVKEKGTTEELLSQKDAIEKVLIDMGTKKESVSPITDAMLDILREVGELTEGWRDEIRTIIRGVVK